MNIKQAILTENDCYKAGKKITVRGLMLHSVGCPQPSAEAFVKSWNVPQPNEKQVCVHAFIDTKGDVYQTLPWDHRAWHGGSGAKGSVNDTHIGVEMTEPSSISYTGSAGWSDKDPAATKAHVLATYKTAVELFAYLAKLYGLDPLADGVIISHSEGCKRGIASNHGDVEHIWSKFGLTMEQFRKDVKVAMTTTTSAPATTAANPTTAKTPIMGKAECTAEQLNAYAKKNNPNAPEYGAIFIEEGAVEGVRGDVAFCQSCLETGFFKFGGDVDSKQNNFCGLGATGGGAKGAAFATARDGIRAQIQHLKAYASAEPLKQQCLDPRFGLVTRGIAPNWEDLNGRWAVPGNGYGENIAKMWNAAKAVVVPTIPATPATPPTAPAAPNTDTPSDWAAESWAWAKANGITDGTNPKGNITREQVACMIHRFSKLGK